MFQHFFLIFLCIFIFTTPSNAQVISQDNSADTALKDLKTYTLLENSEKLMSSALCDEHKNTKELSTFRDREKAERFMSDIRALGFNTNVCREVKGEGETYYKVFVMDAAASPEAQTPSDTSVAGAVLKKPADENPAVTPAISDDIFERKKRYFHPFISVTTSFTDNIYNTKKDRKSDWVTVLSPGIWLSVPHTQKQLSLLDTSVRSPGGFIVESLRYEFFRRFMAYLFYQADIELYSRHSSENTVKHRVQARLDYRMVGGLSFTLSDEYLISHDDRGKGISNSLDKFHTNSFNAVVRYDTGRKLMLKAAYSNFMVRYDASGSSFMKRTDNAFSWYVSYRFRPKTSIFAGYEFIDVNYAQNTVSNSREYNLWTGMEWDITTKTRGIIKAGYGTKKFADHTIRKNNTLILEGNIQYRLTAKTSLNLMAWRKTNETDISGTYFILSNGIKIGYLHKLTSKISDFAGFSYIKDRYKGDFTLDGRTDERTDNYYTLSFGLQYEFRKWFSSELGYIYSKRDSNFSEYDYSNNTFYFKLNSSM